MIKVKNYILLIFILLKFNTSTGQIARVSDLTGWTWLQVNKNISKKSYVSVQYEARFNHGISQFNRSNFYFLAGKNITKKLNLEGLYQFNTTRFHNSHVFYVGLAYRFKLSKKLTLIYRNAFQHTQYFFTGIYQYDKPLNQYRTRIRLQYKINNYFKFSLSAEPTFDLFGKRLVYLSKVRSAALLSFQYNKYNTFHLFYFFQPNFHLKNPTEINNVIGLSYAITLPDKLKRYKKIFKSDLFDENKDTETENRKVNELF